MDKTRRRLLSSLALSPAAFLLPDIRRVQAQQMGIPKRLIIFCTDHGTYQPEWRPVGVNGAPAPTQDKFQFGSMHASLTPFISRVNVLDGLSIQTIPYQTGPGGNAHMQAQCHMLTGMPMVDPGPAAAGGPSLDQIVVKTINSPSPQTKIPSLSLSRNSDGPAVSWYGARQSVSNDGDPEQVYKKLFPKPVGQPSTDTSQAQDASVLNFSAKEMSQVAARLPKDDRMRLEQHAQAVRDLEMRLGLTTVKSCSTSAAQKAVAAYPRYGTTPHNPWGGDGAEYQMPRMDAQLRNLQAAFACDLTRVAVVNTGELAPDAYGYTKNAYGTSDLHDLAHQTDGLNGNIRDPGAIALIKAFFTKQTEVLASLLGYLDEVKEADGKSLLDHSLVLWIQDVGRGNHSVDHLPWMTFGSAGGAIKTGRYLNVRTGAKPVPHNRVLTSIANVFGAKVETVGDARVGTGGLAAL
ncbi:MAG: DUF1552 domain-containing protein [Deltaproteobacteria bacterium]|nr:DUF1552 domain-containing protein [Deltaproteobacteria bacterium]